MIQKYIPFIKEIVEKYLDPVLYNSFISGSLADGTFRRFIDIDLGIEDPKLTTNEYFSLVQEFEDSEPLRESLIQRFDYTFELSWKLMSSILKDQLIETYGVKNILPEAYRIGLITDIEKWLEFAEARNLTSFLYKESIANDVAKTARVQFRNAVDSLLENSARYLS